MIVKINKKPYSLKPVSKMTFDEFNKIIVKGKVTDLTEYLSLYCDIPADELIHSKLQGASIPALHQSIFNVNISQVMKERKDTVKYDDTIYLVRELALETFGQQYMFDMYRQEKDLNIYELSIYALAIALSESMDTTMIEHYYSKLCAMPWIKILPQGFFLAKKFSGSRMNSLKLYLACIAQSKKIMYRFRISKMKLIDLEQI